MKLWYDKFRKTNVFYRIQTFRTDLRPETGLLILSRELEMNLNDLNPYIRFAEKIRIRSSICPAIVHDCRLFYTLSGMGDIVSDNKRYPMKENSLFFCPENTIYAFVTEGFSLVSLNFDLTQSNASITEPMPPVPVTRTDLKVHTTLHPAKGTEADDTFADSCIYVENGEKYLDVLKDILMEFKLRKIFFREISGAALKGLLTSLARSQTLPEENLVNVVSQTLDYINAHFGEPITNDQLAKIAGYHPYHLNRIFLKHTGQTLHQYVLASRIRESKNMLLNSELPLSDIAEQCGFNSVAHFSSYFKQISGRSPSQYRHEFQAGVQKKHRPEN